MAPLPRRRMLLVSLLATLVLPALFLSVLALNLLRDFEALERDSWQDYAEYVLGIVARDVERALWNEEQGLLGALRVDPPLDLPDLLTRLPGLVGQSSYFRTAAVVTPEGTLLESSELPALGLLIGDGAAAETLAQSAGRSVTDDDRGPIPVHHRGWEGDGGPLQLSYFSCRARDGAVLGMVVALWDVDFLRDEGIPARLAAGVSALAPEAYDRDLAGAVVELVLMDAAGRAVTAPVAAGFEPMATRHFSEVLPFWQLAVDLETREFEAWVRRVRLTHWALVAAMVATILAGAFFLARWFAREVEYAELKTGFVSNVSHELKTPLALIRLYAETLELGRASSPEEERRFLQVISKEADRLTEMIDRVLDVAQPRQPAERYRFAEADLVPIVRDTLDVHRLRFTEAGVELDSELPASVLRARVDAEALARALLNLLDNAIKYSGAEPRVRVMLARQGDEARVVVEDQGIGIPKADRKRVFDAFYRVERGDLHGVHGVGLGLSIVREIVAAHRGTIRVDSEPGRGSRFIITLPLLPGGDGDARPAGADGAVNTSMESDAGWQRS